MAKPTDVQVRITTEEAARSLTVQEIEEAARLVQRASKNSPVPTGRLKSSIDPVAGIRDVFNDLVGQLNERMEAQGALNEWLAIRIADLEARIDDLESAALGKPLEELT